MIHCQTEKVHQQEPVAVTVHLHLSVNGLDGGADRALTVG